MYREPAARAISHAGMAKALLEELAPAWEDRQLRLQAIQDAIQDCPMMDDLARRRVGAVVIVGRMLVRLGFNRGYLQNALRPASQNAADEAARTVPVSERALLAAIVAVCEGGRFAEHVLRGEIDYAFESDLDHVWLIGKVRPTTIILLIFRRLGFTASALHREVKMMEVELVSA